MLEANDQVGYEVVTTGIGALLIPIAAGLGLISLIAFAVLRGRPASPQAHARAHARA